MSLKMNCFLPPSIRRAPALLCAAALLTWFVPGVFAEERPQAGELEIEVSLTDNGEHDQHEIGLDLGLAEGVRLFGEIASAQPLAGSGAQKLRLWGIGIEMLRPFGDTWSAGLRLGYEQERERGSGQAERETAIDAVLLYEPAEDGAVFEFYVGSRRSDGRSRAAWGVDVMREISDGVSVGVEFVGGREQRPNTQARIEFEISDQWSLHLSAGRGRDGRVGAIGIEYALPLR